MYQIHDVQLKHVMTHEALEILTLIPIAADDNWFLASAAPTAGANKTTTITSFTSAVAPGYPVVPVFVVTENAGDTFTAVVAVYKGYDQFGNFITESVAATNSSGTWTGTALNAFTKFVSWALTITGTVDADDRYIVGFAKTIGFGKQLGASADVISKMFNGAADAGTVSVPYSTYVIAGTPDAADILILLFRPSFFLFRTIR